MHHLKDFPLGWEAQLELALQNAIGTWRQLIQISFLSEGKKRAT